MSPRAAKIIASPEHRRLRVSDAHAAALRATLHAVPKTVIQILEEIVPKAAERQAGLRLRTSTLAMDWQPRNGRRGQHPVYRTMPAAVQTLDVVDPEEGKKVVECYAELTWLFGALGPAVVREWLREAREGIEAQLQENQVRRG
jgi:hypothetical protein